MRVAVLHEDRCQPKRCMNECFNFCPPVRNGVEVITWREDDKPLVSEPLCIGCGICVHKCPHDALTIINLPEGDERETAHRYGQNDFRLFRLPAPKAGQVVGLLGANGTGKTTAISLLAGELVPNLGDWEQPGDWPVVLEHFAGTELYAHFAALADGSASVALKPQYVDQIPKRFEGTLRELLVRVANDARVAEVVAELGLTGLDQPLAKLSGGELQKGAIAATLLKEAELYFFDEPCSYLDIEQRLLVAQRIAKLGTTKSVVVIEHDLAILDYVTEQLHLLYGEPNAYGIVSQPLGVRHGINSYLEGELREENVRLRDSRIEFLAHPPRTGWDAQPLVSWPELEKQQGSFTLKVGEGEILQGQVLGVVGGNATGKTTFVRMLAGDLAPDTGKVELALQVSYKPQYITPQSDVLVEELLRSTEGFDEHYLNVELMNPLALETLMRQDLESLSGGELQRVAIAECLLREADLYLFDEPSAYLDANQRMVAARTIRRCMERRTTSALVVDHDVYFIDYVSDGLFCFSGTPGEYGLAEGPFRMRAGMNHFLKRLDVTFRRDRNTNRPRINKPGSRLDRTQKASGEYYYSS
jgi:ATP-binding cassette subfamily E protein 1